MLYHCYPVVLNLESSKERLAYNRIHSALVSATEFYDLQAIAKNKMQRSGVAVVKWSESERLTQEGDGANATQRQRIIFCEAQRSLMRLINFWQFYLLIPTNQST